MQEAAPASKRMRITTVALILLASGVVVVALIDPSSSNDSPAAFEPNDTPTTATGPLELNRPYVAALETESDQDYFYLMVPRETQLGLTLRNLGGGLGENPTLEASISGAGKEGGETVRVREFANEVWSARFPPGKFTVLVTSRGGFRESYSLSINGVEGTLQRPPQR